MHTWMTYVDRIKAYLKAHRSARIAVIALAVLLALFVIFHPYGTKTYLLLGMDNYGSLSEIGRSDVTMLVQVDFTRSKISAVSFARDMFLENESGRLSKINTIVRTSDEEGLCKTIERNFDVKIDGWFRVNFTTVIELVDAIGGAQVDLTEAEVRYLSGMGLNVYPENPLSEGPCRLNGAQALAYARCRKLDNDLGRGARQGKLINAMVQQTGHLTSARIAAVFSSLKHAWRSSLSLPSQIALMGKALWLRGAEVIRIGVPFEGTWHYGNAGNTRGILIQTEANQTLLHEALGLPSPRATATPRK